MYCACLEFRAIVCYHSCTACEKRTKRPSSYDEHEGSCPFSSHDVAEPNFLETFFFMFLNNKNGGMPSMLENQEEKISASL